MSGDLISRSALLEMLRYNAALHTDENGETRQLVAVDIHKLIEYVEKMPTAFDVDEAVEQLGKISELIRPVGWSRKIEVVETKAAVDILRANRKEPKQ